MEEKLLSIMIYSNLMENKKDIFFYIKEEMFFNKDNRLIFKTIKALFEDNNDIFTLIKLEEFYKKIAKKIKEKQIKEKIVELLFVYNEILGANINYYITEVQNKYFGYLLKETIDNTQLTFLEKKSKIKEIEKEQEKIAINHEYKDGIFSFADKFDDIYIQNFEQNDNFYSSGWNSLDEIVKIKTGYLMVISGYPSRGKSTFVDNLLVNLSKKYQMSHLIASFETDFSTHCNTLIEMYCQDKIFNLRKNEEEFYKGFDFVTSYFYKLDNSQQWSIDDICKRAEYAKNKYDIKTLVIDPYNKLKRNFKDREDLYVGNILSQLCSLAKKLNILVIFVAHPKKPDDELIPTMYNISGSGDWYNMADYGIIIHRSRDEVSKKLQDTPTISIQKVKNNFLGNPSGGEIKLIYSKDKRILKDMII